MYSAVILKSPYSESDQS